LACGHVVELDRERLPAGGLAHILHAGPIALGVSFVELE